MNVSNKSHSRILVTTDTFVFLVIRSQILTFALFLNPSERERVIFRASKTDKLARSNIQVRSIGHRDIKLHQGMILPGRKRHRQ